VQYHFSVREGGCDRSEKETLCRIEESFPFVRSLPLASQLFQLMPRRRGEVAYIAVPMVVRWRGEGGRPHIAPTGDLAGVLQALVITTITMHHRADIIGIPHATRRVLINAQMSAFRGILLQKSKVAGPRIFRENTKREAITDSYNLNRIAEVACEFNVRR
jgi:hypothetical protein